MTIVTIQECPALVDVHGDPALSNKARLVANILQSSVQNIGQLTSVILPGAFQTKVRCCKHIFSLYQETT